MGRVLILTNSSGGLYDFRNELMEALVKEHQVFISVPDDTKTKELTDEGCQIIKTSINRRGINPVEDLKLYQTYHNMMKELQPDLVISYTIKPNIYGGFCAGRRKIPYIVTITGLGAAFDRDGLFKQLIICMYRAALKKAECIFFQNEENRKLFRELGIKGKSDKCVMGSGVNLKRHSFEPYPKREETRFLYVGRVMKEKGILEYLEAAKRLHSDKVYFDILGYCEEDYQEMLDEMEREGVIHQFGFHTEVHPYLTDTDAVVITSYHEGMSNVLLEAAATGRPVIASNISGCLEGFEEGKTGYGFTPGNAVELTRTIEKFLKLPYDTRVRMGQKAREKMEKEFDRRLVTEAYMKEVHRIQEGLTPERKG